MSAGPHLFQLYLARRWPAEPGAPAWRGGRPSALPPPSWTEPERCQVDRQPSSAILPASHPQPAATAESGSHCFPGGAGGALWEPPDAGCLAGQQEPAGPGDRRELASRQHRWGGELHVSTRQARPRGREGVRTGRTPGVLGQVVRRGHRGVPGRQGKKGRHLRVQVALTEFKRPGPSVASPGLRGKSRPLLRLLPPPHTACGPRPPSITYTWQCGPALSSDTPGPSLALPSAATPSLASPAPRSPFQGAACWSLPLRPPLAPLSRPALRGLCVCFLIAGLQHQDGGDSVLAACPCSRTCHGAVGAGSLLCARRNEHLSG